MNIENAKAYLFKQERMDALIIVGRNLADNPYGANPPDKVKRRIIEAGAELFYRDILPRQSARRAAHTTYSGEITRRKRAEIKGALVKAIVSGSMSERASEYREINEMDGDTAAGFLYLIVKARDTEKRDEGGNPIIKITASELSRFLYDSDHPDRRKQVGDILERLRNTDAIIVRKEYTRITKTVGDILVVNDKGRANYIELVISRALVRKTTKQFYSISLLFLHLIKASAVGGYRDGKLLLFENKDALTPTASRIARKVYIQSKVARRIYTEATLKEIACHVGEAEGKAKGVNRRLQESVKSALLFLKARGMIDIEQNGNTYTIERGATLYEMESRRGELLKETREQIAREPTLFIE